MAELDRWALHRLQTLNLKIRKAYKDSEFHLIYHTLHNFCAVDMSAFYLDVLKDRLYTEKPDGVLRRSAQTAMYEILSGMIRLMAPVLSFTAEEAWAFLPAADKEPSVHLADFPELQTTGWMMLWRSGGTKYLPSGARRRRCWRGSGPTG